MVPKIQRKHSEPIRSYKAGVILLTESNKFLLVKNYDGKWTFPKGGIEADENPQIAAARELYEETGIQLPLTRLRLTFKYYKHTYFICNAGGIDYDVGNIKNKTEITAIGWFCFDHLEEYQIAKPTLKTLEVIHQDIIVNG